MVSVQKSFLKLTLTTKIPVPVAIVFVPHYLESNVREYGKSQHESLKTNIITIQTI